MIKAIETHYDGCRFRSRLEARWAVFLNHEGITWEYEPQGFTIDTPIGKRNYLPDFWLGTGQWAEVKGYLDEQSMIRLWALACGLAQCEGGNDIVIMGDVPKPGSALWPVQLHAHQQELFGVAWDPTSQGCALHRPHVRVRANLADADHLTSGFPFGIPDWADEALLKAREARFEWGESG